MKRNITICGILADECENFYERARGLILRKAPEPGHGLLIPKCNAIHTLFMSFAINAIFLDKNNNVVKIVKNIRPWRFCVWGGLKAVKVLETAATS